MESDLAQIKLLLWLVLALQVFFVAANLACRWLGCGKRSQPDYADLLARERYEEVLSRTEARLNDYPTDADALYFRARAFECMGMKKSAQDCVRRLIRAEPRMAYALKDWIDGLESASESSTERDSPV
jgi:tetratricopeptide (TPR) repeat protein